jgi:hypothetical protein
MTTTIQADRLKFSVLNAKLEALRLALNVEYVYSLSLPSGWTCPGALDCLSKADRVTGKITDGPKTKYRCFAASMEARNPALRAAVWHNFDLIKAAKTRSAIATLILASIPTNADVIRIHVGGDMYSLAYMGAWLDVATARPNASVVVFHPDEADALGLEIDHDDTHAAIGSDSFALLIHGTQPKGSDASAAIKQLKAEQIRYSYA